MTLEEFRNKMRPLSHYAKSELINAAWEEATKAGRKAGREDCIAAIKAADDCGCGVPCDCFGASSAISVIRMLSNE